MGKAIYVPDANGETKKVKKIYVGIEEDDHISNKQVKKVYVGVKDGETIVPKLCYSSTPLDFSFDSSQPNAYNSKIDSKDNWEIAILKDGTLTFNTLECNQIDIFLVGAGGNGAIGNAGDNGNTRYRNGGRGGHGGYVLIKTIDIKEGDSMIVTIGQPSSSAGANGGATSIQISTTQSTLTCSTEESSLRRVGGGQGSRGIDGFPAFNDPNYKSLLYDTVLFGASAAGGGSVRWNNSTGMDWSWNSGGDPTGTTGAGTSGGGYGSNGHKAGVGKGSDATVENTGAGGGSGSCPYPQNDDDSSDGFGIGATGILLIRNHKQ